MAGRRNRRNHDARGEAPQATTRRARGGGFTSVLAVLLILAGVCVFSYPIVADLLSTRQHDQVITNYSNTVHTLSPAEKAKQLKLAREYNDNLAGDPLHDPFVEGSGYALPQNYTDVLNVNGDGVMGYLSIPKIKLNLPIYHGTDDDTLAKGVGHMRQTALPIGGKGNRSVLTGHRGLPSAELFTRLDELKKGDLFTINVLDEIHAYKVVSIQVVKPDELDKVRAIPGRDLVTLVTCTPYGINTHRLLVTGERTAYHPEDVKTPVVSFSPTSPDSWFRFGGLALVATLVGVAAWKWWIGPMVAAAAAARKRGAAGAGSAGIGAGAGGSGDGGSGDGGRDGRDRGRGGRGGRGAGHGKHAGAGRAGGGRGDADHPQSATPTAPASGGGENGGVGVGVGGDGDGGAGVGGVNAAAAAGAAFGPARGSAFGAGGARTVRSTGSAHGTHADPDIGDQLRGVSD